MAVWMGVTLLIYWAAIRLFRFCNQSPLAHPLITTVVLLAAGLILLSIPIAEYQQSTNLLTWLLGPATVALAIPLRNQLPHVKHYGWRLLPSILVGGLSAPLIAWIILSYAEIDQAIQMSILSKSITTPLAIEVTEILGGYTALAAVFVVITGIMGVLLSDLVFRLTKLDVDEQKGLVLGTIAHAIGTAQGFLQGEKIGAFATLALCINGILTALILPIIFHLLK